MQTASNEIDLIASYQQLDERIHNLVNKLTIIDKVREQEFAEKNLLSQKLETLLELLPAGVIVIDRAGKICQCNQAATQLFNSNLLNANWSEVIANYFVPRSDDGLEVSLKNGKRISIATKAFDSGLGQLILLSDLTQTRELQSRLSQQQRLESMGRMMAFLAHQVRTPLATMLLYSSNLQNKNLSNQQVRDFSKIIKERLIYLETLVNSLLIFVKNGKSQTNIIPIRQLVDAVKYTARDLLDSNNIQLLICNTSKNCNVAVEQNLFVTAIINLLTNSIESKDAKVTVWLIIKQLKKDVAFIISDTGSGMSQQQLNKAFEAFTTTKSSGTGLGLAVVKNIIESFSGKVMITTEPGTGTKVTILLPKQDKD